MVYDVEYIRHILTICICYYLLWVDKVQFYQCNLVLVYQKFS